MQNMPARSNISENSDDNMSDSSDSNITKSSFRVSVCLKKYFKDIRALCFVLVTRKRTVKWLERKIRKLFDLHGRFYLTTLGHLLPSSERLGLLNPDDTVEVIPHEIGSQLSLQNEGACNKTNNLNTIEKGTLNTELKQKNEPLSESTVTTYKKRNIDRTQLLVENINESQKGLEIEENVSQNNVPDDIQHDLYNNTFQSNVYEETQNDNDTLQQMKQSALALLDNTYGVNTDLTQTTENIVIPRKRKRVRRKRQLAESSPKSKKLFVESTISTHEALNNINGDCSDTYSADHKKDTCISDVKSLTMSTFVTHNEVTCVRKPRIVRSIIDTI